jgi:nicotinate phosphoribosyltransferase
VTHSLFPDDSHPGLLTDLYELTMAVAYHAHGLADQRATFELWVRKLPRTRNYLIAAGLEQAVHYLRHFRFAPEQIDYLRRLPLFAHVPADWFDRLAALRFAGDLWAMPEGTVAFGGEPLLRVTAPP